MIHKACMPVYMNSGKIVADGTGGKIEGSTRGPRGPKNQPNLRNLLSQAQAKVERQFSNQEVKEESLPKLQNIQKTKEELMNFQKIAKLQNN